MWGVARDSADFRALGPERSLAGRGKSAGRRPRQERHNDRPALAQLLAGAAVQRQPPAARAGCADPRNLEA